MRQPATILASSLAVVAVLSQANIAQGGVFYGVDFDARAFLTIDTSDATTAIIATSSVQYTGLAFNKNSGVLYARSLSDLYTINPVTGVPSLVGGNGVADTLTALAYNNDYSTLYSLSWGPDPGTTLYTIDESNGNATAIGSNSPQFLGSLAINSLNQAFVVSHAGGDLYSMDLSDASLTFIATLDDAITAMAFDENDELFGVTLFPDTLVKINTSTGGFTTIGGIPFVDINGMAPALATVPEPSSFALLGLGALGLIAYRRKRRAA